MNIVEIITKDLIPMVVNELMEKRTGNEIAVNEMPYFIEQNTNKELVNTILVEKIKVLCKEAKEQVDKAKYENYALKNVMQRLELGLSYSKIKEKCETEILQSDEKLKEAMDNYTSLMSVSSFILQEFSRR